MNSREGSQITPGVWQSRAVAVKFGFAVGYSLLVSFRTTMSGPRKPAFLLGLLLAIGAPCAEAPLVPYTVCEIVQELPRYEGKSVAAVGRYSFRQEGRWLGEQDCAATASAPPILWLSEDANDGPKPPADFELDGVTLSHKLADIRKHTALGKFRFGSTDYDRWAVVYGRVEPRKGDAAKKAPADLVFRGDGVIVFLAQ
jgi:hypothetical protein